MTSVPAVADLAATAHSESWPATEPVVSVVVSTYGRAPLLAGLLAALEAQTLDPSRFEVVVVDDGSPDDSWDHLQAAASMTPLALLAVRLERNRGVASGRNAGVARCRSGIVAFTDDDCLPQPGWLDALVGAFGPSGGTLASAAGAVDVVQGRTEPDPTEDWPRPWARTLWIREPSWLFETCNLAYRRTVLAEVGGFDEHDRLTSSAAGRTFGEDVVLGWRVMAEGAGFAFAPDAVVHHRWMPGTYRDALRAVRALRHFPALTRRYPGVARSFWHDPFLSRDSAATGLAALGAVAVVAGRGRGRVPGRVLGVVAGVAWLVGAWPRARVRRGRPVPVRLAQLALIDAVALASLVEGSVRHRRLVL